MLARLVVIAAVFSLSFGADCQGEATGEDCMEDPDCNDGSFCNGPEICLTGKCIRLPAPDCNDGVECTGDRCDEELRQCINEPPDVDGDGSYDAACLDASGRALGDDCDDGDSNRYPGNTEICDATDHDEDCDLTTFGSVDADGDGYDSAGCCNSDGVSQTCGSDCDDSLASVFPGSQVCNPAGGGTAVKICQIDGSWQDDLCPLQGACHEQPNGLGVCVP